MLPADSLAEILTNLSALNLQSNTAAAVLSAVLAPLLRSTEPPPSALEPPAKPLRRSRVRSRLRRAGASRKRKYGRRRAVRPSEARDRALAALRANPGATIAHVAKLAKCSSSTAVNARKDLAKEARRQARNAVREATPRGSTAARPADRRQRAQQFL